jgi:hypothetical protein
LSDSDSSVEESVDTCKRSTRIIGGVAYREEIISHTHVTIKNITKKQVDSKTLVTKMTPQSERIQKLFSHILSQIFFSTKTKNKNVSEIKSFSNSIIELVKEDTANKESLSLNNPFIPNSKKPNHPVFNNSLGAFEFSVNFFYIFIQEDIYKETWSLVHVREKFNKMCISETQSEPLVSFETFWKMFKKDAKDLIKTLVRLLNNYGDSARIFEFIFKPAIDEFCRYVNIEREFTFYTLVVEEIFQVFLSDKFFFSLLCVGKDPLYGANKLLIEYENEIMKVPKCLFNLKKFIKLDDLIVFVDNYEFDIERLQPKKGIKPLPAPKRNIDELYEYIIAEDKSEQKKKRKTKKKKKNKKEEEYDFEVEMFKRVISDETINAKEVTKIKPKMKGDWKNIINNEFN